MHANQAEQEQLARALSQQYGISLPELVSEETLLEELELSVIRWMERGPEAFFQLMYRLDIPEQQVMAATRQPMEAVALIARLIYERQLQKIRSRQQNPPGQNPEPGLGW